MASEDDEYNGYFIPKGTVVLGNAWWAFQLLPPSLGCLSHFYLKGYPP